MRAFVLPLLASTLVGCTAGAGPGPGAVSASTVSAENAQRDNDAAAEEAARPKKRPPLPDDIVARSALSMHGVALADDVEIEPDRLAAALAAADAICIGEDHDNPHEHWAELQLLLRLLERARMSGRSVALGLEMVERPEQSVLDRFNSREIDRRELAKQLDWEHSWGFDFALYSPLLGAARAHRAPIIALNAPMDLVSKVAHGGLDALDDNERRELPQLDLQNKRHRRRFDQAMHGHPHVGDFDNMYLAQVLRDETMARTAARWLSGGAPARQLVIIAGAEHCRKPAIPARIQSRTDARVVSVRPYIAGEDDTPDLEGYQYAAVLDAGD